MKTGIRLEFVDDYPLDRNGDPCKCVWRDSDRTLTVARHLTLEDAAPLLCAAMALATGRPAAAALIAPQNAS